jgi:hypothetical protein
MTTTVSPKLDQETIFIENFSLRVQVIGVGEIGQSVLYNFRAHYGRSSYLDEEKSINRKINDMTFFVVNSGVAIDGDFTYSANSMVREDGGRSLLITITNHANDGLSVSSSARPLSTASDQLSNTADSHLVISTADIYDEKKTGSIIFERIRRLISLFATSSSGAINVSFVDFCQSMTPLKINAYSTIKTAWSEAQGADKVSQAVALATAPPSFREHLQQAYGIVVNIICHQTGLMTRDVPKIRKEISKYTSEHCVWMCSIYYDENMAADKLKLEILAAQVKA